MPGRYNILKSLYKKVVVNSVDFKTSRFVTFENTIAPNTTNISRYDSQNGVASPDSYVPIFYKIKLYHQLHNGYLDLTDDV
jgi:hypothetical protein